MLLIGWMFIALIFKGHRRSNVSPFYTDNMRLCYSHLLKWSRYNMYRTNAQRPDPFFRCDLDLIICHNLGSLIQLFDGTFNPLAWFCQWSRKFHWNPTRIDRDIAFFMRFHAFWHVRFWNKRILYILYIYIFHGMGKSLGWISNFEGVFWAWNGKLAKKRKRKKEKKSRGKKEKTLPKKKNMEKKKKKEMWKKKRQRYLLKKKRKKKKERKIPKWEHWADYG